MVILATALHVTLWSAPVLAQSSLEGLMGQRLRIKAPAYSSERMEGTLVRVYEDEIDITSTRLGGGIQSVPVSSIEHLQVEAGIRHYTLQGLAVGGAAGLLAGALVAVTTKSDNPAEDSEAGLLIAVTTGAGALAGLLIGSRIRSTRWQDVPPGAFRVGSKGGLELQLAFGVRP